METLYVVQSFHEVDGAVLPEKPVLHGMEALARRSGEQLAMQCEGVLVYAQGADTDRGEYSDPVILAKYGRVPDPQKQGLYSYR
ncbi:hypothetical protein [Rhodanobacter sp. C03]|uniref:hypothetical protein n=1 Tax=Rhodanobacter sp. C03 TaxID=1945858 RepID=UPI000987A2F4|nr:hypothetical protein [Rhodanobacter sp. C03]OOG55498.1 hypothetical protein B0E48_12690 [Rhodanobacter sp. C03]